MEINVLSAKVIGSAIEVHKHLGPGLLESVYQKCLEYELCDAGLTVQREVLLPVRYKHLSFSDAYRIDLIIENRLIIELKSVESILPVHGAQLLSYLKLSGFELGLLINFNVPQLSKGIKRIINKL
ncbi:MAG: GxxExxY protein [Gammaproteobacteria bacterium]|nr:GxxExxY protein [Gammaproteobacteria bacterium]